MGLFELFRRQNNNQSTESIYEEPASAAEPADNEYVDDEGQELDEQSGNQSQVLTAKLFFKTLPVVDADRIQIELAKLYPNCVVVPCANGHIFSYSPSHKEPESEIFECCLLTTPDMELHSLPREAYKQNWHWKEASTAIQQCSFEVLLTEKQTGACSYKQRTESFIDFVIACISVLQPDVIYSKNAEKLLEPGDVQGCRTETDPDILHPVTNIRMFKMADSPEGAIIMDTLGLNALGLPDLEIIFHGQNPAKIAELLLRYCYFIYDIGDNVQHGEYLEGINPGERWKCERRKALLAPDRVVLHVSLA